MVENAYKATCDGFWEPHLKASAWMPSSFQFKLDF
jgi:hypothetical protein